MAKATIDSGNCGEKTSVEATMLEDYKVALQIESSCPSIQKLAADLKEVDAFNEISFRRGMPEILQKGTEYCSHAACPVPVGIVKAVEVAAGLALPQDVTIQLEE